MKIAMEKLPGKAIDRQAASPLTGNMIEIV
jgi:hypothetical protein